MPQAFSQAPSFHNQSLLSIPQLSKEEILCVLDFAEQLSLSPQPSLLRGKLLGLCFYEPSTRTRLSFEAAMYRLGGQCMGFADMTVSSVKKKESLHDTMKMMEQYVDAVVLRHPLEGAAKHAAASINIPLINGGDGSHQHPSQTLLDLFSIRQCQGTLDDLKIAIVGDLKHGRTVHSLVQGCTHFNSRLYFVSPPSLELPQQLCNELKTAGIKFSFHHHIDEVIPHVDLLYMTRIQEERLPSQLPLTEGKHSWRLRAEQLQCAPSHLKVLHPLPRVQELHPDVDATPHAYYFDQARHGLFVRQALLALTLGVFH